MIVSHPSLDPVLKMSSQWPHIYKNKNKTCTYITVKSEVLSYMIKIQDITVKSGNKIILCFTMNKVNGINCP